MKKLATLLLAAGLVFSAATGASAIDFKAKGQWVMSFDYGDVQFMDKGRDGKRTPGAGGNRPDDFEATQRVRLQLDAVASEALSGSVFFEIGNQIWGKASQGGALGADGTVVEVRRAYLDWVVPQTDLKFRMGIQGIALPAFTNNASQVFDADVAGIVASYKFNDNVSTTLFWARPYNDNYLTTNGATANTANFLDNMDMFALLVPMTFDGVKVTPWVSYAAIGKNTFAGGIASAKNTGGANYYDDYTRAGLNPAVNADKRSAKGNAYGSAFFAGLTGEITMADPFRFAWDVNYGSYDGNGIEAQKRQGWYASLLGEYKMDWATPGLYVWYASGDDSNIKNGSERMPSIAADGTDGFSSFASTGQPYIGRENILSSQWTGTWGIGARLKDMSFIEDLKHTFRVNYIGGTNSPSMAKYILGKKDISDPRYGTTVHTYNDFNTMNPTYLTTMDSALEFGLVNTYKVYDNLTLYSEVAYMAMMMDKSDAVWGKGTKTNGSHIRSYQSHDPWNINVSFVYDF